MVLRVAHLTFLCGGHVCMASACGSVSGGEISMMGQKKSKGYPNDSRVITKRVARIQHTS